MSRVVERASTFSEDYAHRVNWYLGEGGPALARRLENAIEETIDRISFEPTLGHNHKFKAESLRGVRSLQVAKPFDKLLLFYRVDGEVVQIWRLMHSARNLSRRLLQPND